MTGESAPYRVVIAGGSIAALETIGALRRLAGDRVSITLVAPDDAFRAPPQSLDLTGRGIRTPDPSLPALAASLGAAHVRDRIAWVHAAGRTVHTVSGARFGYDALVVAIGAHATAALPHALTLKPGAAPAVAELLSDVRAGRAARLAFVSCARSGWLLALYETALATARAGAEAGSPLELTLLTAERAPLAIFGRRASRQITGLLEHHGVRVLADVSADVSGPGGVSARHPDGSRWETVGLDRIVATPRLRGPFLRGLAVGDGGFVPIDAYCRVAGHHDVFAAGDVTTYPVKHGGIAAQQADVVACGIAALAGLPVARRPFRPRLEARLLTGAAPLYLGADLIGGEPFGSVASDAPARAIGPKVIAAELDHVLDAAGPSPGGATEAPEPVGEPAA